MTLPGYGGGDGSMAALRYWLKRWGYQAEPWLLGRNLPADRISQMEHMHEFQSLMLDRIQQRVDTLYENSGNRPVSLVGWSLGGIYANAMAQREPEKIRRVISLGTPYGDPRGTAAWAFLKRLHRSTTPDHEQNTDQWISLNAGPREVPTSVIYSPVDGIVSPSIARLEGENIENIPVKSSHLGFAWNPSVLATVASILARPN
ncbi:alpha/beta fold hydrolase [Spongiibacter sp.]|uniref:alpha/beta fold hydrolase n=1 Tax=Spongiibacter sp. TaxID=2024860 RepID=UPI00356AC7E3